MLDITKFTADEDYRAWLNRVFDFNGFLAASNSHYVVIDTSTKSKFYGFPKFEDCAPKSRDLFEKVDQILNNSDSFDWHEMPDISKIAPNECSECDKNGYVRKHSGPCLECDGDGEVVLKSDYNTYVVDCKRCDGEGVEFSGLEKCPNCLGTKKSYRFVPILLENQSNKAWALNAAYALRFSNLNGLQIAWRNDWQMYAAKFDNGAAILMPMRT